MKLALTIEQMSHLKELGLDCSKASMHYEVKEEPKLFVSEPNIKYKYPAFCLSDIVEILPIIYSGEYGRNTTQMTKFDIEFYPIIYKYKNCKYNCEYNDLYGANIILFAADTAIDAAYEILCWCIENKFLSVCG